jgi:hypothetical protein
MMVVLVVLLALAMFAQRLMEIVNDVAGYVHRWQSAQIEPTRTNRQSDAVNRPQTDPVQRDKPRFETTELTSDELVQLLALITVVRDGERRQLSQDIISRAAGISKVTAAAMIADVRGTPEPNTNDPYQFEKTGPRETYQRTGVKPLRG